MKVNKDFVVGFSVTFLIPFLGVIYTFLKVNRKNYNMMLANIFLFVFFITLNLYPYQDLYRRYIETYYIYNSQTTLTQAIDGHVDFTFYILSLAIKKIGIPFPFLPAFMSALSVTLFIKSILSGVNELSTDRVVKWVVILGFLLFPTIQLALGVRWGMGISLLMYGYFSLYNKGKKFFGLTVILISILTHFSMVIIVPVLISASFIRLNRFSFLMLSIMSAFLSTTLLPFLLSKLGILGSYASVGYGSDSELNEVGNLNSIIATGIGFVYTAYFTFLVMIKWKLVESEYYLKIRNVALITFVFTCLSAISLVAFRRYTNALYFLFIVCVYFHYCLHVNSIKKMVVMVSLFAFLFSGLFLQRRPILLSELWKGLYTPAVFYSLLTTEKYNSYLMKIDDDGDWKGNKINK
ncbi:EpsG family protein [Erwinia sp. S43]|uniref:EpsG family protein n=1 Tax=Erwinia sp. S43 TaxID=2769339 RepID=UPI00190D6A50|nr:EpsG family protein [Erwinia sp. S43]MBK0033756.1 EpsG family protein [Erwinia sp. S43]